MKLGLGLGLQYGRKITSGGGGGGFDVSYQAVLNYATAQGYTLPSAGQQVLQNQLVLDLKANGFWNRYDSFGIFAQDGDINFGLIDWRRLVTMTAVNSPTFTPNIGIKGDGSTAYINTNFIPSVDGVNYTLNDAGVSVYAYDIDTMYLVGTLSDQVRLRGFGTDSRINGDNIDGSGLDSNINQNIHLDRTSSTQIVYQQDESVGRKTIKTTNGNNSTSIPNENIWLLRILTIESSSGIRYFIARNSMTETEKNTQNTILNTYLNSI